jgi:hypothetical protein
MKHKETSMSISAVAEIMLTNTGTFKQEIT